MKGDPEEGRGRSAWRLQGSLQMLGLGQLRLSHGHQALMECFRHRPPREGGHAPSCPTTSWPCTGCSHVTHTPFPMESRADTDRPATEEREGPSHWPCTLTVRKRQIQKTGGQQGAAPSVTLGLDLLVHHRKEVPSACPVDGEPIPCPQSHQALGEQQAPSRGSEHPSQRGSNSSKHRAGIFSRVYSVPDVALSFSASCLLSHS